MEFEGFEDPKENWSKLPHALIGALPLVETVGELKIILYILRHTWGFQDDQKKITLDEFANGRKRKDGSRLDCGTGLTIPTIRDGIKRAVKHGFIIHTQDAKDKARVKNFYTLKMRGEKDLHTGCKKDSGGVKNSLPRSEKDTKERKNNNEETNLKSADAPTRDYLTDVFEHANGQNKEGIAEPGNDDELWLSYRDQFLSIYKELTGLYPDAQVGRPAIVALAMEKNADPDLWQRVVYHWKLNGWNPRNIAGMIDCYQRGEAPTTGKGNDDGKKKETWFTEEDLATSFLQPGDMP